jgi:hypothetical protein
MGTGIISSSLIADRYDFGEFFLSGYEKKHRYDDDRHPKTGCPRSGSETKNSKKLPAHRAMNRH